MRNLKIFAVLAALAAGLAAISLPALAQNYGYYWNGHPASYDQASYLASLGYPPGAYAIDGYGNVAWVGDYVAGSGSGEVAPNGDWSHTNPQAGMGVGGTSDGCIYTTSGWSNC